MRYVPRRLEARLRSELKDFGVRVQFAVFECLLEADQVDRLRRRVLQLIDPGEDSVRLYRFCLDCGSKVEIHGQGKVTEDPDVAVL